MSSRIISGMHPFVWVAVVLLILGISFSDSATAQVAGGALSGTVTDPSGAGIPQAQVTIKNVATGVEHNTSTNESGLYILPNLLPGEYQLTITAKGFNAESKSGITINVGARQVFDLVLQIGTVTHTVQVTTDAPAIQLASSDISATVNATTVRELPLNGRSWTDLAALQPGVETIQTQPTFAVGADRGNRGFGQQLTISGARPQQNNYRLDGVSLNDYANGAPGSVLGGNLGVDAIQEFSVLTSNYSAEYGKTSGGVVNATTRSGSNSFHGSGYEFLRNSSLDAANFFEAGQRTPFKRNQFGGAIGGPIVKNRTFFFADYEGIRQSKGIADVSFVPSTDARGGLLHFDPAGSPPPGCTPTATSGRCTVTVAPAIATSTGYLRLYPDPGNCGADACQFTFSAKQIINENFVTTRIDHKFSDRDSLFGTYLYDRTPYSSPDSLGNVQLGSLTSRQIVAAEETHSFTTSFINAARFGYNHELVNNNQSLSAIRKVAADTSLAAFAGRDAAFVNVGGLSPMSGGVGGLPTYFYHWNSFQAYDDAFFSRGTHTIKFGFAFERMLFQATALTDPNGIWFFDTLSKFLQNEPTKFQGGIASSLTPRNFRQNIFGGYVQDDWRRKPNLTLNLGLRYEMTTVLTETNGKLVNLRNLDGTTPAGMTPHLGDPLFNNPTLKNFEPRIGFAWDPFRNGKTSVRGGFGIFDALPLPYELALNNAQTSPFHVNSTVPGCNFAPANSKCVDQGQFPLFANVAGGGTAFFASPPVDTQTWNYVEPRPKRNYIYQWNLNVQRQVTGSLSVTVAYAGSRALHNPFQMDDIGTVYPTHTSAGWLFPTPVGSGCLPGPPDCSATDVALGLPASYSANPTAIVPGLLINPNAHNGIQTTIWVSKSWYNALQIGVEKRMSHGLQVQGSFTWSKTMDTSSGSFAGDNFAGDVTPTIPWWDLKIIKGLSDFQVGRNLVINALWQVPTPAAFGGPAGWIARGWGMGGILELSDGVPTWPLDGLAGDPMGQINSEPLAIPDVVPGCSLVNASSGRHGNLQYINPNCLINAVAPAGFDPSHTKCDQAFITNFHNNNPTLPPLDPNTCINLLGNLGRNTIIGPGLFNLDYFMSKDNKITRISESFDIQFRAEFFNILNHPNFAPPVDNLQARDANGVPISGFGQLTRLQTPGREIQFALKVIW